jgi:hypothetical protein
MARSIAETTSSMCTNDCPCDHDVVGRRIQTLNLVEHLFLVNVDQHSPADRAPHARTLHLARCLGPTPAGRRT